MIKSYFLFITQIYRRITKVRHHAIGRMQNSPLWSWIGVKSYKKVKKILKYKFHFNKKDLIIYVVVKIRYDNI